MIILTELGICIKFAQGEFQKPFPDNVVYFWCIVAAIIVGYGVYLLAHELGGSSLIVMGDTDQVENASAATRTGSKSRKNL